MKFLAVVLALVISAEGIKVQTTDESKEKEGLKMGNYYWQNLGGTSSCCMNSLNPGTCVYRGFCGDDW